MKEQIEKELAWLESMRVPSKYIPAITLSLKSMYMKGDRDGSDHTFKTIQKTIG